jgi:hypothetical protein
MKTHRLLIVGLVSVLYSQPGYAFVQEDTAGAKQVSLREETEALAGELEQLSSEFFALSEQARSAEGEELLVLETQMRRRGTRLREDLGPFVTRLVELREQGEDIPVV